MNDLLWKANLAPESGQDVPQEGGGGGGRPTPSSAGEWQHHTDGQVP